MVLAEIYYYIQPELVIRKLSSNNPIEVTCAYDLLELMTWEYYARSLPLPAKLLNIDIPIPEPAISEIKSEHFFHDFKGETVGKFLSFLIEHG